MFSCFQTPSLLSFTLPGLGSRAELLLLGGFHGGSQPGSRFNPSQMVWHCQVQTPKRAQGSALLTVPPKLTFFPGLEGQTFFFHSGC